MEKRKRLTIRPTLLQYAGFVEIQRTYNMTTWQIVEQKKMTATYIFVIEPKFNND